MTGSTHVGRFAPSPTGPLHLGSLVAALGSFLAARAVGGTWRVRIDDIDPPREVPGAADRILRQLDAFGLHWDGAVVRQSERSAHYAAALTTLSERDLVYRCSCTRREIAAVAARGPLGTVYPGTCRQGPRHADVTTAVRFRLAPGTLRIDDTVQGRIELDAEGALGDVILQRRDGLWAYHLATTVDDAELGITHVVRGADLLPAALVQTALQTALTLPALEWAHLPLVHWPNGDKLSKQTAAPALDPDRPLPALRMAWRILGQAPAPASLAHVTEFMAYAQAHWTPADIPRGPVPLPPGDGA